MRKTHHLPITAGWLIAALAGPCMGQTVAPLRIELRDFVSGAPGWSAWAQREDIQPRCFVDPSPVPPARDALAISGNGNPAEYGGWAYVAGGIVPGRYYRFAARYRVRSVPDERRQVIARLDWLDAAGHRVGQPDYAYETSADRDWTRVTLGVPAPEGAARVRMELALGWAPQGTVWWDDIILEETRPPTPRLVRIGTISQHPRGGPDENLGAFLRAIDEIAGDKPDIVCLGEEILVEGSSRSYTGAAEEIPGPSTRLLGEKARRYGMYIVAGLTERDGKIDYNTAVLIDRRGEVTGRYRKVYLPREEIEGGLTPGDACPVFDTDFGRIGMMICWDAEYGDAARAMALKGAEIIFVPAAGGYLTLLRARALENHLYIVSSGYDVESAVIDPTGEILFSTMDSGVHKTLPVDLSRRFTDPWLGDMRPRFHKELRLDLVQPK